MKKIVLSLLSTASAVVLLFGYHTSTSGALATAQEPIGGSLSTNSTTTTSGTGGSGGTGGTGDTGGSTSTSDSTGAAATVTGDVVQTRWGPVQVQIVTEAGAITGVEVLQYPSGNHEDEQINSYALPILIEETLDAQSADIDMVSGATVTSEGYVQSLQSALDQAGL